MWSSYFRKCLKCTGVACLELFFLLLSGSEGNSASFPQVWQVPADNPNFVGREDVMDGISATFKNAPLKTAVINGHQGFGKSQVAKHYAHQNFKGYDVVWWFRANQYLKPQFEKFALAMSTYLGWDKERDNAITTMDHERLISLVKEGIRRKNFRCLIIFDDAQSYTDIEPYILFSHEKTIHTLVTTKNGNLSQNSIQIKPFERETSVKYINIFLPNELQKTKELLADHLSDCPAALALSINYIKSYPGMNIERYLRKYQEQKLSLFPMNELGKQLGSSVDDYETELVTAIRMNMEELKQCSHDAFQLLGLLSLVYRDEVPLAILEKWVSTKGIKTDMKVLIGILNKYSLIEITKSKNHQKGYVSMQELIQKIVNSLIPLSEKKQLVDEAVSLLKGSFSGSDEKNYEAIFKDNKPLLHALKLSKEANNINHHNKALSSLRVRVNAVLIGAIRDLKSAKEISEHLKGDFDNQIKLDRKDEIRYYIDLSFVHAIYPNYDKAIFYGQKALKLSELEDGMSEEKLRLFSNLIQYYANQGLLDECQPFIIEGKKLFISSKFQLNNAHYINAVTTFLLNRGEVQKSIDLIHKHKHYLEKQDCHPMMHFFLRFQLAEALIKNGDMKEAINNLTSTAKLLREFYNAEDNHFFCKLYVLEAVSKFSAPNSFLKSELLLQKAIQTYKKIYNGYNKHRSQAFACLQLGKLYHLHKQYDQAKAHYLESEGIFEKILKNKKIDDVSELYKQLAILGVDMRDDALSHTYFKKHQILFDFAHPRMKEMTLYLDEKGVEVVL